MSIPNDSDRTLRPNAGGDDRTLRPSPQADRTVRPGANNSTIRPMASPNSNSTVRPSLTLRPSAANGTTLRPAQKHEIDAIVKKYEDEYTINGVVYQVVRPISDGTGEAQIFLVTNKNKQYALKLYYVGIEPPPNHQILEIIKQTPQSGLLVDIMDHGVWNNPRVHGESRHYEVMTYCKGDSLDKISLRGNEDKLCEIAKQAAAAIDFCHKHHFIHRDIKPGNFFFADEARTQVVLGDFGISVRCNEHGVARTDQARTRIYAAPEMYYTVPGENIVEIDTKSDFYSLGMVLLCLWMGEKEFKEREFELMKRKRTGDLPFPEDLSKRTLQLIKALTTPQPEKRCGFLEIVRWARGEDVFSEMEQQSGQRRFNVVFNASKNQIAHSPEELADFMREDHILAIKYLYTGKLTKWLTENQHPELVTEIEEIVEKRYPKDQMAGLYAALYILNVDMPYYDIKGKPHSSVEEIAQSLVDNFTAYQSALTNVNHPLYLFFNAHEMNKLTDDSVELFNGRGRHREALWRLIYELDPSRSYELIDEQGNSWQCNIPEEILKCVYNHPLSSSSWNDLSEESFLVWLAYRDKGLVGKIRTQLRDFNSTNAATTYGVLYNLSPKVSYTLQLDELASDYYFTHTQIAIYINQQLMENKMIAGASSNNEYSDNILGMLSGMSGSRLYFYLKSKGVYEDKIEWIEYCFELQSKDNQKKAGPYNWIIATYKTIRGLGVMPFYHFKESNKDVISLEELKTIPPKEVKTELESGSLRDWLTTFFQEDPFKDLSQKYAYEQETIKYLKFIEKIDSKDADVSKYHAAADYVNKNLRKLKFNFRLLTVLRVLFAVFCLLPILGFAVAVHIYGLPFTENPLTIFSPVALGSLTAVFALLIFATSDFNNIIGSVVQGAIVGAMVYYGMYYVLENFMPYAHFVLMGILILLAFYMLQSCYLQLPMERAANSNLLHPGFEETKLEPLHFAFRAAVGTYFVSSISRETVEYTKYLKESIAKFAYRAVFSLLIVGCLTYLFVTYSPEFRLDTSFFFNNKEAQSSSLVGTWKGTFEGREATLNITSDAADGITATIHVQYKNFTNEELKGTFDASTNTINFDDVHSNGTLDGKYTGTITGDEKDVFEGIYQNYKTNKQVKFSFKKEKVVAPN